MSTDLDLSTVAMGRRYVALARVGRPHGVRGELKLKVYNEGTTLLSRNQPVLLRFPDGTERPAALTAVRPANKALLVRLEGVEDRNAAEEMRDVEICVARDDFPPLDEGEFYACDVTGAEALMEDGVRLGRITELRTYPTCEVLVVARRDQRELEIPLTETYVGKVDVDAGRVLVKTIEGLE